MEKDEIKRLRYMLEMTQGLLLSAAGEIKKALHQSSEEYLAMAEELIED